MAGSTNWRSKQFADAFMTLDREQFAVEFLRRNPAYIDDYKRTHASIEAGDIAADDGLALLARRWGLSFRPST